MHLRPGLLQLPHGGARDDGQVRYYSLILLILVRKGHQNVDVYIFHVRADLGVTGVGRHCYQCGGRGGLCEGGAEDGGVVMDCGEGVQTCVLARNSE